MKTCNSQNFLETMSKFLSLLFAKNEKEDFLDKMITGGQEH